MMLGLKSKPSTMNMNAVRKKARDIGINPGKMKKAQLIHEIQKAEGNYPCFASAVDWCEHSDCCFMADCFTAKL